MSEDTKIIAEDKSTRRTARHITAAQVTAAAAIITSVLALAVSLYETRIMRSWQQASTQPIVQFIFDVEFLGDPITGTIKLRNMGQGAAYVEGLKLTFNGEVVENLPALVSLWSERENFKNVRNEFKSARGYLGPQDSLTILTLKLGLRDDFSLTDRVANGQAFAANVERSYVSVCYCSVFERCWISDMTEQSRATPISVCPADYT